MNRGGSWNNDARNCRVSNRNRNNPDNRNNNLGLRLALPQLMTEEQKKGYKQTDIVKSATDFETGMQPSCMQQRQA